MASKQTPLIHRLTIGFCSVSVLNTNAYSVITRHLSTACGRKGENRNDQKEKKKKNSEEIDNE